MKNHRNKIVLPVVFCFSFLTAALYGQEVYSTPQTMEVLKLVSAKLDSLKAVRYQYKREALYTGENYHNIYNTDVFIDFTSNNTAGYRFQAEDDNFLSCYNGAQYFGLDKKNKTIDIKPRPGKTVFESLSPLYNSLIALKNIFPALIKNDSIKKTITDTIINGDNFYFLKVELYDHYFGNLGGINDFTAAYIGDKHKPYEIIINKRTNLPYQYTSKFKDRKDDLIAASFLNIDTDPKAPEELSWFYSTYSGEYQPPKPKQPLVALNVTLENWVLPSYDPGKTDSVSLHQYRGKIVLLDFWIKTCGSCLASFPYLNELQQKFGADKFQLLSINTEDSKDDIAFFYKKNKPVYKMLFEGEKIAGRCGVSAFPTAVILGKNGTVIYAGNFDKTAIEKLIRENLR
jgi:thiol-disulfide isomerase/thioredoxin